ncbi:MAG TPA: ECF-type sigma factor, partial [Rhodanobacteraceae bacterium]|nr:ECF-type sigma factor [Rhodanobacteraceae bacterium]
MGEVTRLLEDARHGQPQAWDQAVAMLYEEMRRMARRVRGHHNAITLNATALVSECYLRLAGRNAAAIQSREHFLAVAARAMRQILVNYARDRTAAKRGGGATHLPLHDDDAIEVDRQAEDLLLLDAALEQLEHDDARMVRVIDCRVFCGMTETETATALD